MIERFQGDNRNALIEALLRQPFLQNDKLIAESIIAVGDLKEFKPGESLIVQNDDKNDVFLLIAGSVSVVANGVEVRTLGPGDHVGEMSAIDSANPRSATVSASGTVVALQLSGRTFIEVCDQYPTTWKFIARTLSNRLFDRNRLIKPPNDKPRLFIISSVEALDVANEISSGLQRDALPVVWTNGVFWASSYPLEALENAVESSDFAVAVAKFEDVVQSRGASRQAMRDNVVFELGMFIGRLGRHRTFLVHPAMPDLVLPSDLKGITPLSYIVPSTADELTPRIGPVCTEIRKIIQQRGVRRHAGA
ncbi:TIR domain-containing protein [Pseudorhodoplanes sinuspersici]|uniref:TIR domain-containing protein n=1 Tax=Pseudorhodoplanes sinuspersici TaxID=1235591 RepID=UPI0011C349E2|nr:TIR domain-containing protein [Pseudorhodoplanes sinuspersici]